jgi:UDP-4-amino-4,6-dideoxy-N-acetyl-beta-L-altrosamine transaminase
MTYIPYGRQEISAEDIEAVVATLRSDWLTQGPSVQKFESALALACGARHAVAVNSATAALHVACVALGLGPGDRLWTSPNTFVASANCALYCGASVDFVDIDLRTGNMSTDALAEKLEWADRTGSLPKIVVPVHFAGQSCDLRRVRALADRYGFRVVEDAAHAVGGKYRDEPVGSCRYSDVAVFSFHPVKIVTTGEGGMALTNDSELAACMARLRTHGVTRDSAHMQAEPDGGWYYEVQELGWNYRITDIQAALGLSQIERLHDFVARRAALAARYDLLLADSRLTLPWLEADCVSSWHLYVIGWNEQAFGISRGEAFAALRAARIGVQVHYIPLHTHPFFRKLGFAPGQYPNAEAHYARAITLPLHTRLTNTQQDMVVDEIMKLVA